MSIQTLKNKVDRMQAGILASIPAQAEKQSLFDNRTVFTREQWLVVDALLEQVTPRLNLNPAHPLEQITDDELEQLHIWVSLYLEKVAELE